MPAIFNTTLSVIFVFFIVVLFHEFGHFITAKLSGIKVHEFAIGMGPKIFKFNKGETDYTLRALPIGGFVKMEGEDEASDDVRSFNRKSVITRMIVIASGAIMNFVLAFLILVIIFYNIGAPTTTIDKIIDVPAEQAGLKSGDKIISINDIKVNKWEEVVDQINESNNRRIKISIIRDSKVIEFKVNSIEKDGRNIIGISPVIKKSLTYAIKSASSNIVFMLTMMFKFFGNLIQGNVNTAEIAGPIGMVQHIGSASEQGFLAVLFMAAIISVNLGFFNLLPIPALDGSRLMFLLIESIRGKKIDPEKEGFIHFIGFIVLIAIMILVAYKDIKRFNVF